jgi:hypothetical protein
MINQEILFSAIKKYRIIIGILLIWVVSEFLLFHFLDIRLGGDSMRYIDAANDILNGKNILNDRAATYMGYDLLLAGIFALGLGNTGVVLFQIILTLLATLCLYKITYRISRNCLASYLTAIFYITALELHSFNFYILTDSFSASMFIISFYLISHVKNAKQLFYTIPIIFLTASIRPLNFIILLSAALFIFISLWYQKEKRLVVLIFSIFAATLPFLFLIVNKMAYYIPFVDLYLNGQIIWSYKDNAISLPANVFVDPNYGPNTLMGIFSFAWHNLAYMAKLATLKVYYLFAHTKPFYSPLHNWLIIFYFYPIYILAALGLLQKSFSRPTKIMVASYCLLQIIIVMFSYEDWDGRFLQSIMPIIYIFSAIGLVKIFGSFSKNHT